MMAILVAYIIYAIGWLMVFEPNTSIAVLLSSATVPNPVTSTLAFIATLYIGITWGSMYRKRKLLRTLAKEANRALDRTSSVPITVTNHSGDRITFEPAGPKDVLRITMTSRYSRSTLQLILTKHALEEGQGYVHQIKIGAYVIEDVIKMLEAYNSTPLISQIVKDYTDARVAVIQTVKNDTEAYHELYDDEYVSEAIENLPPLK